MPRPIPPEVQKLIRVYQEAQINLINIIATKEARGNATRFRKELLASVNQELAVLNAYAVQWAQETIPAAYRTGVYATYEAFRRANIDVGRVRINSRAVRLLMDNAAGQLTEANIYVGRRIQDELRQIGLEVTAQKFSTGAAVRETKQLMVERMAEQGITAIRDSVGRPIRLDAYAQMVARTTTAEAANAGAIDAVKETGHDLVQISQHNSPCPICAPYEGRVFSLTGATKGYPLLSEALPDGYVTFHPNCMHVIGAYEPEMDENAEATKEFSNRSMDDVPPRKQAEVDNYRKNQREQAARRRDRHEWERARLLAPEKTPRTFSGYRAVKRAGRERYQEIREVLRG